VFLRVLLVGFSLFRLGIARDLKRKGVVRPIRLI
jgi:hypothetical protein